MPVTSELDRTELILHHYPTGRLDVLDIKGVFTKVTEDDSIPAGIVEFVHFDEVEEFSFYSDTATKIPHCFQTVGYRSKVIATIFIAQAPLQYGISRMMQTLFELYVEGHPVHCVKSLHEAEQLAPSCFRSAGEDVS